MLPDHPILFSDCDVVHWLPLHEPETNVEITDIAPQCSDPKDDA